MRKLTLIVLACLLASFGCNSYNHYMSKTLEQYSPSELMQIEARSMANLNALIRRPQPVPYVIDGKDVPYEGTLSGRHVILIEPGNHTFEGLIPAWTQLLPNPKTPEILELVYEIPGVPETTVSPLPNSVSKNNYTVVLKPQSVDSYVDLYVDSYDSVEELPNVIEENGIKYYIWKWTSGEKYALVKRDNHYFLRVKGDFFGQTINYTWIQVVKDMDNLHAEGIGDYNGLPGRSFSEWWKDVKDQEWHDDNPILFNR